MRRRRRERGSDKMLYVQFAILPLNLLVLIMLILILRKQRRNHDKLIDVYLNAERVIHAHIREHVIRERDMSWAVGLPPIATFGIKSDGTLMSDEELEEARRIAAKMPGNMR